MALFHMLRKKQILFAGNRRLKIYGLLKCVSGKRMKVANRLFFTSEDEAIHHGFRPCARCMQDHYRKWKAGLFPGRG